MIDCPKCGTMMSPSLLYHKSSGGTFGMSAGSACPKCEPHRAKVEDEPQWFKDAMEAAVVAARKPCCEWDLRDGKVCGACSNPKGIIKAGPYENMSCPTCHGTGRGHRDRK